MKRADIQPSLDHYAQLMQAQEEGLDDDSNSNSEADSTGSNNSSNSYSESDCDSEKEARYRRRSDIDTIDTIDEYSYSSTNQPPETRIAVRLTQFQKALLMTTLLAAMSISTIRVHTENRAMSASLAAVSGSTATDRARTTSTYIKEYESVGFSTTSTITTSQSMGNMHLSKSLQYLANISTPVNTTSDVPLFFHIPRSGGSTIKDILGMCFGKVEATDVGVRGEVVKHQNDLTLRVINSDDGAAFVNVDTSTAKGIHRAKRMGLVESGLADVLVSQHLHPVASLFNADQQGRMFTMMRHPIHRAVSMFHYLGVANWEPTYDPSLAYVSIEMYARSSRAEHNWAVRFLSNELVRNVNDRHLEMAKEILRQKCLIGLLEEKTESFLRFSQYFGWSTKTQEEKECRDRLLYWGWSNKHAHPEVEEGSAVWELLYKKNSLDMQLYEYAKELFREQAAMFQNTEAEMIDIQQDESSVPLSFHEESKRERRTLTII